MAKRKRATSRSDLFGSAVRVGRRALKEAERRVPPDLRRQVDRRLRDADKMARAAIKQLQTQVQRASTRSDVNNVLKRIDALTRQARQIAQGAGSRAVASRRATATRASVKSSRTTARRATATAKRAATAKAKPATTRKTAATAKRRTPATRKAAAPSRTGATRRSPATRRRRTSAQDEVVIAPMTEIGEVEIFEVIPEP